MSDFTDEQIEVALGAYRDALLVKTGAGIHWSLDREIPAMRAALRTLDPMPEDTSDGYHTFAELYDYRMLYNAHAANGWHKAGIPVVKSWRHSDGEECFGGGWFIVTAQLPTGQVSNHYEATHWDLFDVPAGELAPEWDGHTPSDAAERLREALKKETKR